MSHVVLVLKWAWIYMNLILRQNFKVVLVTRFHDKIFYSADAEKGEGSYKEMGILIKSTKEQNIFIKFLRLQLAVLNMNLMKKLLQRYPRAVVVAAQWSPSLPCIPMIRVWILPKFTVSLLKCWLKNNQKNAKMWPKLKVMKLRWSVKLALIKCIGVYYHLDGT